jgi:hypothetical protein
MALCQRALGSLGAWALSALLRLQGSQCMLVVLLLLQRLVLLGNLFKGLDVGPPMLLRGTFARMWLCFMPSYSASHCIVRARFDLPHTMDSYSSRLLLFLILCIAMDSFTQVSQLPSSFRLMFFCLYTYFYYYLKKTPFVTSFTVCLHYMYKQYRGPLGMPHGWTVFQLIGPISLLGICHEREGWLVLFFKSLAHANLAIYSQRLHLQYQSQTPSHSQ